MKFKKDIILYVFILFFSCDKDGTIVINPELTEPGPNQGDETFINNLDGDGCSENNLCYSLEDVYFDFSHSSGYEVDFYKFNNSHLALGANHGQDAVENNFKLKLFNYNYLLGIPSTSINENINDEVLIFIPAGCYHTDLQSEVDCCGADGLLCSDDLNLWYPAGCYDTSLSTELACCGPEGLLCGDDLNSWNEEDTSELSEETIVTPILESAEENKFLEGDIKLSTDTFSNVKNVVWSDQLGRYVVNYVSSDEYSESYLYSQYYDDYDWIALIDPVLYPIYGDVILVDFNENVYRNYTIYSTIDDDDVLSKRRKKFKIKSKYIPDIGPLMYKRSTDCNDNYRKDDEEVVLYEGHYYAEGSSDPADSFEAYCLSLQCSDGESLTEESCCGDDGSLCSESSDQNTWDASVEFDDSENNLCLATCSKDGEDPISMEQYCWDLYSEDTRSTGTCITVSELTFCDRGNNLYDTAEYYVEQNGSPDDPDAYWGENENFNLEPLEDRNCNGKRDLEESTSIENDCPDYPSGPVGNQFCDKGNGKWDPPETCYANSCTDNYDYKNLYSRSESANQLIVDYTDQENPEALLDILPQWDYNDTGEDGCFDIFEDASGSCICEMNDYTDLISCETWLGQQPGGLLSDSDSDGYIEGDLNKDGEITELDIAASPYSEYNYGECKNDFSGSEEDCCSYYGCWDAVGNRCDFTYENCELDSNENYWEENLDPNCDNFASNDSDCTASSETEFDGERQDNEQARNYSTIDIGDLDEDGETDDFLIVEIEDYFADIENYSGYTEHYYDTDKITTKVLGYNDGGSAGGDQIEIIEDIYVIDNVSDNIKIKDSENTLRSNPIIDQIDFDSDSSSCSDLSQSTCANNSEYSWCLWDDSNDECIVDYELFYENAVNNYHLVKTEFYNSSSEPDYDYMIFKNTQEHIVKMIHPYYHFSPGGDLPLDIDDFSEEEFWQTVHLNADTLLYTFNGNIANGQSYYSMYSLESDTAHYEISKEYTVKDTTASLVYYVDDPNCILFNKTKCESQDYEHCAWNNEDQECYSVEQIKDITNCLRVTRIIETIAIGSGMSFKLKSDTYFKPGFDIVKEDISIDWNNDLPWALSSYAPISSIQYKEPGSVLETNQSSGFLNNYELIDINDFENIQDFNYSPYKITNTLGIQRIEYPINY